LDVEFKPDQQAAFDKFCDTVKDSVKDSPFLSRKIVLAKYFKANLFNPEFSQMAVTASVTFRKTNNLDTIDGDPETPVLIERFGGQMGEYTKVGHPIVYILTAKWGLRTAIHAGEVEKWKRAFYLMNVKAAADAMTSFEAGKVPSAKYAIFVDYRAWTVFEGACLECLPVIAELAKGMESHWPEFKSKITAVNAEKGVQQVINIVKPILSPDLQASLSVYGERKEWWDKVGLEIETPVMDKLFDEKKAVQPDALAAAMGIKKAKK